jgi:hypothetical protein
MLTLVGRVTETIPTSGTEVSPALVTIVNGPDGGKTTTTNASGFYSIESVRAGTLTLVASADGFESVSHTVNVGATATVDFQLDRAFGMMRYTISGDLKATDGTCSDGTTERPCRIVAFPVHNAGPVEADLQWNPRTGVNLDVNLVQTATQAPIANSSTSTPPGASVRSSVTGHGVYELHITYAQGTADVTYTLTLSYPN